jgi:hypothetical protein
MLLLPSPKKDPMMKILYSIMLFVLFALCVYRAFLDYLNTNKEFFKIVKDELERHKELRKRIYVDTESSLPYDGISGQTAFTEDTNRLYIWDYSSKVWTPKYASNVKKPLVKLTTNKPAAKPLKTISYETRFYVIKKAFLNCNYEDLKALLDERYYKSIISIILTNEPSLTYVQLISFNETSEGEDICVLYKYTTSEEFGEKMEFWYFNKDTYLLTDIKPWI